MNLQMANFCAHGKTFPEPQWRCRAFTLLEVTIAAGILFTCLFAILAVLSNSLNGARSLKRMPLGAGMLASQLSLTNRLFEGVESGDFEEMHPGYQWTREIQEVDTNGLFRVDFVIKRPDGAVESQMSVLLFRPNSPPGRASGGMGGGMTSPVFPGGPR